ncbi:response regulator [Candidatus Parcubacteria bacterium]|nr:response regulator [Candidatus Parcubacteria bacterium]
MRKTKKILIIEDDSAIRKLCKKELRAKGYKVKELSDGKYAIKIIKKESPDLVLLGLLIPKKDGFEIVKEIKREKDLKIRDTPMFIMSKIINKEDIREAKKLGVTEYMIKADNSPMDIANRINSFLG